MIRKRLWSIATALLGLATAYSALNVGAGIGLGYDAYPGGKEIIVRWQYAAGACFACFVGSAIMMWRARRPARSTH
jgi:hypothetical protein